MDQDRAWWFVAEFGLAAVVIHQARLGFTLRGTAASCHAGQGPDRGKDRGINGSVGLFSKFPSARHLRHSDATEPHAPREPQVSRVVDDLDGAGERRRR
jgi:hypothetical protein